MTTHLKTKGALGLTPMQDMFVREYLIDLNAKQAWIRAGGEPATAHIVANKLMKPNHPCSIAIARAMAERSKRVGISADRVLEEIGKLSFGDPRVLFREDGSLKAPHEYNQQDAAMIEGIKTRRIVEIGLDPDDPTKQKLLPVEIQEVKLVQKTRPLDMLMRHLGLYNDKLDVNINMPLADRLRTAMERSGETMSNAPQIGHDGVIEGEYEEIDEDAEEAEDDPAEQLRKMLRTR